MNTPEKVWTEAADHLEGRRVGSEDPAHNGIVAHITAQPFSGDGYVFGQVGWLDEQGNAYGLRLPDNLSRHGTSVRPLYIGLGRHDPPVDPEPCL